MLIRRKTMHDSNQRLSAIQTCWQEIRSASDDSALPQGRPALWLLLERYGRAVERYILGAVRNEDLAQELAQEFAIEFLKGACKGADPNRGRFRDFVKGVIQHLIANHFRKGKRLPGHLPTEFPDPAVSETLFVADDESFVACWREELLARAWESLLALEQRTGQPYHAVLKHKADNPDQSSEQMAEALGRHLNKPINAPAVRKALQRAREKFADLLLDDLSASLRQPEPDALVQELIDLRLYEYCRPALERKQP
jgi:RNA polymerase sigma-70 factor (ECF subfamily)